MEHLIFVVLFTLIHAFAYTFAGAIALRISPDMYREKGRVLDYLRDMSDDSESAHQAPESQCPAPLPISSAPDPL